MLKTPISPSSHRSASRVLLHPNKEHGYANARMAFFQRFACCWCLSVGKTPPLSRASIAMFRSLRRSLLGSRAAAIGGANSALGCGVTRVPPPLAVRCAMFPVDMRVGCFSCLNEIGRSFCGASPKCKPGHPVQLGYSDTARATGVAMRRAWLALGSCGAIRSSGSSAHASGHAQWRVQRPLQCARHGAAGR